MYTQLFKPIGLSQLMSYSTEKPGQGTQNINVLVCNSTFPGMESYLTKLSALSSGTN